MVSLSNIITKPRVAWALAVLLTLHVTLFKIERQSPDVPVIQPEIQVSPATTNFTPPFHTRGRHVLDAHNEPIKLASINWYGASDIHFVPSGLDVQHRDDIAQLIRRLGFNSVRLPYADEIVDRNPVANATLIAANPDLFLSAETVGKPRALEVYHAVVESLTAAGLLVIVNNHITQATWCCGINPCDIIWYNDWLAGGGGYSAVFPKRKTNGFGIGRP
jgi:endoglucanase